MKNENSNTYFSNEALAKFVSAQGKTIEKVICHLWQNKLNPNEIFEIIDNVDLLFTDKQKLTIGCNEKGDGLDAIDFNYKTAAIALENEFEGKIKVYAIDASTTKMWKDVIGKKLNAVRISRDGELYLSNAIRLDFENELREIEVNPIDGIIIDYFEEEDSYKKLND